MRLVLVAAAVGLAALPLSVFAVRLPGSVGHPPVDGVESFDHGPRNGGLVALTFDADMTPAMLQMLRSGAVASWYNRAVRDVLDQERVPATIFLTGLWTQTYPAEARSLAQDPLFEIGDHTFDHAAFRTPCYGLQAAQNRVGEITRTQREIAAVTGRTPTLLRFPGDCWDRSDAALARSLGLRVVSGDVPAGDGFNPSPVSVVSNVLGVLRPGSIVMMHIHGGPYAPMTAPALRTIIQVVRQRGLGFATVSHLLGLGGASATSASAATQASARVRAASWRPVTTPPAGAPAGPPPGALAAVWLAPLLPLTPMTPPMLAGLAAALRARRPRRWHGWHGWHRWRRWAGPAVRRLSSAPDRARALIGPRRPGAVTSVTSAERPTGGVSV
jgi:peptidoglycan/xylan/chitin deacetylase (PgdA/CDA1 family)